MTPTKAATATTKAPVKVPTKAGHKAVPLKSDKHIGVVTDALSPTGLADTEQISDHRWLWVKTANAPAVVLNLGTWATEHSSVIYDARLAVATLVDVRRAFPNVEDPKTALTNLVVTELNSALAAGTVTGWSSTVKIDGTLLLSVTKGGKVHQGGARDIAKVLGYERPKAPHTPTGKPATNGNGLTASQQVTADRVKALKDEGAAVKAWKAAGSKGPKPPTPLNDEANAKFAAEQQAIADRKAADQAAAEELANAHKAKQADKRSQPKTSGLADLLPGAKPLARATVNPRPKSGTPRTGKGRKAS